jgi:inner membrane protein
MDNLTHSLVGLVAAKAGLERLSPSATSLCILAANAPDADIVVLLFGDRWDFLQHHRGITHSIVGTACLALIIPLLFYAGDFIRARVRRREQKESLKGMIIASALVSATHPLMDWTNNYGIRLLLPWNPKWFYGDLVFIVDPFLWLLLGGTAFLLTCKTRVQKLGWLALGSVLSLVVVAGTRSGGLSNPTLIRTIWLLALLLWLILFVKKAGERLGANIACAALLLVVLYWSGLAYAHSHALNTANSEALSLVRPGGETIRKLAAMPTLADPF